MKSKPRHTIRSYIQSQLISTILICSLFSATGVYVVGEILFAYLYRRSCESAFLKESQAIDLFGTIADGLDARAKSIGERALVELGRKYDSPDSIERATPDALAKEAIRLGIGDIYLIGSDGKVVATTFAADRGLDLFSLGEGFRTFLLDIRGKGKVTSQSLSLSTRTGHINMYQYYGPPGSAVLIEISTSLRSLVDQAFPGIGYRTFISRIFDLDSPDGDGRLVRLTDIATYGPGNYEHWSLLREGSSSGLPERFLVQAIDAGEARMTMGNREVIARLERLDGRDVDYFNAQFLAIYSIDLGPLNGYRLICLAVGLGAAALVAAAAWIRAGRNFSKRVTRRVEAIVRELEHSGLDPSELSLDSSSGDELSAISRGIYSLVSSLMEKNKELGDLSRRLEDEVTEVKAREDRLSTLLEERQVLVMEVEHRVKNNLQVLSSLVNLQLKEATDKAVRDSLVSIHARILGMSLVHDQLFKADTVTMIEMDRYLGDLARSIVEMKVERDRRVGIRIDSKGIELPPDLAMPIGLIVGELIADACDRALPDRADGKIDVGLERDAEELRITVTDSGGAEGQDRRSLGLDIARILCEQLKGNFTLGPPSSGGNARYVRVPLG
jgi:two-component sensor histidine kinase